MVRVDLLPQSRRAPIINTTKCFIYQVTLIKVKLWIFFQFNSVKTGFSLCADEQQRE